MKKSSIEKQATGLITGLALQFFLGMWINLYIEFPEHQTAKELWDYGFKQGPILLHFIIGTLLIVGSFTLVVRAYKAKSAAWKAPAILGFSSILIAWAGGERFVSTQIEGWSFVMAAGFMLAIVSYVWGLSRSKAN